MVSKHPGPPGIPLYDVSWNVWKLQCPGFWNSIPFHEWKNVQVAIDVGGADVEIELVWLCMTSVRPWIDPTNFANYISTYSSFSRGACFPASTNGPGLYVPLAPGAQRLMHVNVESKWSACSTCGVYMYIHVSDAKRNGFISCRGRSKGGEAADFLLCRTTHV
jgi:hypothetical protein